MVIVCPATVTTPLRGLVSVFAATENVAVPFPAAGCIVVVIHPTLLVAVQVQATALAVTASATAPPPAGTAPLGNATEK
jgi:hypothetical protein